MLLLQLRDDLLLFKGEENTLQILLKYILI